MEHIKFTTFFTKYLQYKNFCSLSALIDGPKTIIYCTVLYSDLKYMHIPTFFMHREWNKEERKGKNIVVVSMQLAKQNSLKMTNFIPPPN